jgi:YD repeat-containing protein
MKRLLTLFALLFSSFAFSQYTPGEIKKLKITRVVRSSQTRGQEAVQRNETWYDEFGNDTAEYNNGELYRRTKYEYNPKGQVLTRTRYDATGNETETAVYTYKPDGTCTVSNTDKSFGMTELTYCDKGGRTTKTVSPDNSERIYTYDTKGRLTKIKSKDSDNGSVFVDIQYTYNPKDQLIKEVSKGDNKWTTLYSYNVGGLVSKVKRNSVTDGVADPEVITSYEYEFQK